MRSKRKQIKYILTHNKQHNTQTVASGIDDTPYSMGMQRHAQIVQIWVDKRKYTQYEFE